MSTSIRKAVDALPQTSVTVYALQGLDFVIPGEWKNTTGFNNMIREVSGETDTAKIKTIADKAQSIYDDPDTGYQKALWVYQTIDKADATLAAAAMANKVGEKISFLSFLSKLTPKPDTSQSIDLGLKVAGELAAFALMNGIPRDTSAINEFVGSLTEVYTGEALMRMVALVCLDGVVPLGPDFTTKAGSILGSLNPAQLKGNAMYKQVSSLIPGGDAESQLGFINQSFGAVQVWMNNLLGSHNLTPETILSSLEQYIEIADDKLDYVAAFLDMSTNYFAHTGTQSVARKLIAEAM